MNDGDCSHIKTRYEFSLTVQYNCFVLRALHGIKGVLQYDKITAVLN
jgi:hypothetical protein